MCVHVCACTCVCVRVCVCVCVQRYNLYIISVVLYNTVCIHILPYVVYGSFPRKGHVFSIFFLYSRSLKCPLHIASYAMKIVIQL